MNKQQLFTAFINNSIEDKSLLKSQFYKKVSSLKEENKIPKPVDDLVDAFFLAAMISKQTSF